MYISKQLKEDNIAEYLLYMWQVEDLIRANGCDIDRIEQAVIAQYRLPDEDKRQLRLWYDGDDADDDKTGTPPDGGGIPETPSAPSSPSRQALGGNKHGLCVAAGQPFAGTGSVPNPHAEVAL